MRQTQCVDKSKSLMEVFKDDLECGVTGGVSSPLLRRGGSSTLMMAAVGVVLAVSCLSGHLSNIV